MAMGVTAIVGLWLSMATLYAGMCWRGNGPTGDFKSGCKGGYRRLEQRLGGNQRPEGTMDNQTPTYMKDIPQPETPGKFFSVFSQQHQQITSTDFFSCCPSGVAVYDTA